MPPLTELEQGALTAWTPAQQAALYHQQLAEQYRRDEEEAEKEEAKKKKKAKEKDKVKPETVTAEKVIDDLMKRYVPPIYYFLDHFGPPHIGLPVMAVAHVLIWWSCPPHLSHLQPLFLSHFIPLFAALRSLYAPSSLLYKSYDDAKAKWQKKCEDLKKSGKEKVEFPDQPKGPEGWQLCVQDRANWMAYWMIIGLVEYVEDLMFEEDYGGLVWWPKIKFLGCIALYWVWETDEKDRQTMGAMKAVQRFLPKK